MRRQEKHDDEEARFAVTTSFIATPTIFRESKANRGTSERPLSAPSIT